MVKFELFEAYQTEEKGRGLRATQTLEPGEELLREAPLSCVLTNSQYRHVRCDYCFAQSERLLRCSRCQFVSYCDRQCQSGDWQLHKYECKCLAASSPKQPPDFCRLIAQLVIQFFCANKNQNKLQVLKDLHMNNEMMNSRKEAFFTFGAVLVEYLQPLSLNLRQVNLPDIMCKASCNSFAITNAELNSSGTGIYVTSSLFNHSCDPNCIAIFNGQEITIRTIKEVSEGEELYLSYISNLLTQDQRQMELNERYTFTCTCHICTTNTLRDHLMMSFKCRQCNCLFSAIQNDEERKCSCDKKCTISDGQLSKARDCMDRLHHFYNSIQVIPTQTQLNDLERLLEESEDLLGPSNIHLLQCYEVAMDGCIEHADYEGATKYALKLEPLYLTYHSQHHPSVGLHYYKLGKLLSVKELKRSIPYLEKALKHLKVSHGEKHYLVDKLKLYTANICHEAKYEHL